MPGDGMLSLIRMVVAAEMILLPVWVGAVMVPPPAGLGWRLARVPAALVLAAVVLLVMAALSAEQVAVGVLRSQAVAVGFGVLLAGMAQVLLRLIGPRAAQVLTAVGGWTVVAGVILVGPAAELAQGPLKEELVRATVHVNPLVVAELELGLKWLHQGITYRLTPLGESYSYLVTDTAWWKTLLGHIFVGSGLLVFSIPRAAEGRHAGGDDSSR